MDFQELNRKIIIINRINPIQNTEKIDTLLYNYKLSIVRKDHRGNFIQPFSFTDEEIMIIIGYKVCVQSQQWHS